MTQRRMSPWEGLAFLMGLAFLNYMDRNLLLPLQTRIEHELHLSSSQIGALSTGFHVVYAFAAPLVGVASDRFQRRTLILISLVAWSLLTMLTGLATGFPFLLLCRSLTGLGEGGYFPTAVPLIGDLFPPERRGTAIAFHGVMTTLGGGAGLMLGGALGGWLGWRAPFFVSIVPGLTLAYLFYRRFQEPPRGGSESRGSAALAPVERRPWLQIVTAPPVLLIAFTACFGAFAMQGLSTFLPRYLREAVRLSEAQTGILSGLGFWLTLVGVLPGGLLSDRLARRSRGMRPLLVALPYLAAAPVIFFLGSVVDRAAVVACYGLAMAARGFAEPNIYGTVLDAVPATERGSAQGFMLMLTFGGASASGLAGGAILDAIAGPTELRTAATIAAAYTRVFQAFAVSALLAGLCGLALATTLRRQRGASA